MNVLKIDNLYWICTQITNLITLSVKHACTKKLRNFRTIHSGAVSLVLKYAQNSNKNCHEISRRESIARFEDIARKVE